jgi:hypothetical protein
MGRQVGPGHFLGARDPVKGTAINARRLPRDPRAYGLVSDYRARGNRVGPALGPGRKAPVSQSIGMSLAAL